MDLARSVDAVKAAPGPAIGDVRPIDDRETPDPQGLAPLKTTFC
jgi:hypothetical protein